MDDPHWKGSKLVATSGIMTIYFLCTGPSGFGAHFQILQCPDRCESIDPNRQCNQQGECVCADNLAGPLCTLEKCPGGCGAGICNNKTNLCECTEGYTGTNCTQRSLGQLEEVDLFNLDLLPTKSSHYRKLLPRFGNSLNADAQGTLWVFGGFSGVAPLNDIRAFDAKNGSWLPITVDISFETPQARYFHAAELVTSENTLFIHGGMNQTHVLNDLWKFDLLRKTWQKLPSQDPYNDAFVQTQLVGHTMTYNPTDGSLLIIGGFSESEGKFASHAKSPGSNLLIGEYLVKFLINEYKILCNIRIWNL